MRRFGACLIAAALLGGCAASWDGGRPGVLVIGTTGPVRKASDSQRQGFYDAYLKLAAQRHPGSPPALSAAAFQEKLGGWATIQTSALPLIASRRVPALISATPPQDDRLASVAGDLVAARSDREGLVWMERVLCREGDGFSDCADKYHAGIFDENTGQELARDRKPKADGASVDVTSYVSLAADPARHTASELDPRALNRCDACKGSLPGSTQSAVPVP